MRPLMVFPLCVACLLMSAQSSLLAQSERVWQSPRNGKTFTGIFVDFKEPSKEDRQASSKAKQEILGKVKIRNSKDSLEKSFELSHFSAADKRYVANRHYSEHDTKQFAMVTNQIEGLRSSQDSVIAILKALESQYPTAPYASVWGGVALGALKNEPEKAQTMCQNGIARIRRQRELDSSRHLRTLAAAYNNSAICYIKERRPSDACRQFIGALGCVDKAPAVIAHNIRTFYDIGSKDGPLKLEDSELRRLAIAMSKLPLEDPNKKISMGWYYSLDLDIPQGEESESSVTGILPPDASLELIATGTGVVCAPGFVVTIRDAVVHPSRTSTLATVAIPVSNSRWELKKAQKVSVTIPKVVNKGGSQSVAYAESSGRSITMSSMRSDFEILHPPEGSAQAELAVLQIEGLKLPTAPLLDQRIARGQNVEFVGYERGPDMLSGSKRLQAKVDSDPNKGIWTIDRWIPGGLRGAPVVDGQYRVIGLTSRTIDDGTVKGECFSLDSLKAWFSATSQIADLKFEDPSDQTRFQDRLEQAIVPILVWGRRSDTSEMDSVYNDFYQEDSIAQKLILRDGWCFQCDGKGVAKCQKCKGTGVVVDGMKLIQNGVNPVNGQPIMVKVVNKVTCTVCDGRRRLDCTQCQNGRLLSRP